MSDKFSEALRHLGHIYMPRSEGLAVETRTRHILQVFAPTGEVLPICGADRKQGRSLGDPALWADSDCGQCCELRGIAPAITKRSLMLDLINSMCDIEQIFLDAMSWNYHNPNEEPIDPDPDGELAKAWLDDHDQILSMAKRFQPTMEKHEGRFSWPTDLEEAA